MRLDQEIHEGNLGGAAGSLIVIAYMLLTSRCVAPRGRRNKLSCARTNSLAFHASWEKPLPLGLILV